MSLSNYQLRTSVAASDMVKAREFYEGKLGLEVAQTGADGSKVYAIAGEALLEVYPSPDSAGGSTATLATWQLMTLSR